MQKLLIKSALFLLLIIAVVFYFSVNFKRTFDIKTDYLATLIDKEARLNSLDSNRLILVGGSNLAFGINSELIEEKLQVKVANLGLHAGLSLKFIINQASHLMKKGDIIVLTLEYPLYLDSFSPDIDLIQFARELYPASEKYYQFTPKEFLTSKYEKFRKYFQPDAYQIDSVFNRQLFNKYGDNEGHLSKFSSTHLIDRKPINLIDVGKAVPMLDAFAKKCKQEGVKLFIAYPCYPKTEYVGKNKERIDALDIKLRNRLPEIQFLNTPKQYVFADSLFFDTIYHLNKKGREIRTQMFIKDLENTVFNTSTNPSR